MRTFSTNQVAQMIGVATKTLSRYIAQGKVPAPEIIEVGGGVIHSWTEAEIERLRKLLPKIANGRKTRHQNLSEKQKAPAGVPVPHKKRRTKKKK